MGDAALPGRAAPWPQCWLLDSHRRRTRQPLDKTGSPLVHVLPKPGVMDPVAQSVLSAIADFGIRAEAVRTLKKYWIGGLPEERLRAVGLEGAGQRRHRAGGRRPAGVSTASKWARPTSSGSSTVPIRRWTMPAWSG